MSKRYTDIVRRYNEGAIKDSNISTKSKIAVRFNKFKNFTLKLPQPGTIALPLFILILLFFVLVPINGKTRLNWLYDVVIGQSSLGATEPNNTSNKPNNASPTITIIPSKSGINLL